MSYLTQPTQDQSLNGIITISDGTLTIENGTISGVSNLDIGDNISCKTLSAGNIYGQNGNLNIGNSSSNVVINGQNITLTGPTVYMQSQTVQTIDNNIELNYNGSNVSAVNSGITVLGNSNIPIARFQTDANLDFVITSPHNKLTLGTLQGTAVSVETVYGNTQISTPSLIATNALINTANITTTNITNDNVTNLTCQSADITNGNVNTLFSPNGTISTLKSTNANITTQNSTSITSGYLYTGMINVNNTANIYQSNVTGTTDSSNISTGSSTCKGGASITKSLYVGGNINGLSNINISQNAVIIGDTTTQNLTVNQNANILGDINITGNTITNNTSTANNIIGTNGTITNLTSSKAYATNQTAYSSSLGHLNVGTVQGKDIRGYNVNATNSNITTLTADTSITSNIYGTNVSSTNGSFNNLSVTQFGLFSLIPPGTIQMTVINGILPPTGWLYCRGQAVDRVVYETLYNAIGKTFGPGNGITTFNIPDFRGMFLRGYGVNGYTDPNSGIQIYSGDNIGVIQRDSLQNHEHNVVMQTVNSGITNYQGGGTGNAANDSWTSQLTQGINPLASPYYARQSAETRPANYSVNYLIKF